MTMTAEQSRQTGGYYAQQWTVRDEYAAQAMQGYPQQRTAALATTEQSPRVPLAGPRRTMWHGSLAGSPTRCWPNAGGALVRSWRTTSPKC